VANITLRSVKGSALTFTEADNNFSNLNTAKLESVSDDTSPSLGGNLDVGNNAIVTTDASGLISIGGIPSLAGLPLIGEGSSIGALTSASDSLVLGVGDADGTKPFIFITNSDPFTTERQISLSVEQGEPILNVTDNEILAFRPIKGSDGFLNVSSLAVNANIEFDENVFISVINGDPTGGALVVGYDALNETTNGPILVFTNDNQIQFNLGGEEDVMEITSTRIRTDNLVYSEKVFNLGTTSGTITPNAINGPVQTITLNGNLTLNAFASPVAGQSITLIVNTAGTGRTLTSSMKFAGGEKTLSTTDTTDIISIFYDGTNYWASLSKDFK
jgi:hypothetical protein